MAPEEMQDLVQDFTAKATAVNAVVQELPNMAAALQWWTCVKTKPRAN